MAKTPLKKTGSKKRSTSVPLARAKRTTVAPAAKGQSKQKAKARRIALRATRSVAAAHPAKKILPQRRPLSVANVLATPIMATASLQPALAPLYHKRRVHIGTWLGVVLPLYAVILVFGSLLVSTTILLPEVQAKNIAVPVARSYYHAGSGVSVLIPAQLASSMKIQEDQRSARLCQGTTFCITLMTYDNPEQLDAAHFALTASVMVPNAQKVKEGAVAVNGIKAYRVRYAQAQLLEDVVVIANGTQALTIRFPVASTQVSGVVVRYPEQMVYDMLTTLKLSVHESAT